MNPFAIGCESAMRVVETGFREYVREARRRGIRVRLIRQGDGIIMRREVAPERRRAALQALRAQLRNSRPAKPGEQTARDLMRELRSGGRY